MTVEVKDIKQRKIRPFLKEFVENIEAGWSYVESSGTYSPISGMKASFRKDIDDGVKVVKQVVNKPVKDVEQSAPKSFEVNKPVTTDQDKKPKKKSKKKKD